MPQEKVGFLSHEIQIGRHYWFVLNYDGIEVDGIIKVLELSGEIIEGRILDTEALSIFPSRFSSDEISGTNEEDLYPKVLVEHIVREVTISELKFFLGCVEENIQDFFNIIPLAKRANTSATRRLH